MTTVAEILHDTRRWLMTNARDEMNRLSGAHDASQTTFTFEHDLRGITDRTRISVDLETLYVWSATAASKTATVERGFDGSTPAAHADDALVYVNPRFSNFELLQHINDELRSLSSPSKGLFRVQTLDITYAAAVQGYNLTSVSSVDEILGVFADQPDSSQNWIPVPAGHYRLARNQSTTDFASGFAITFVAGMLTPGRTARVIYKQPFSLLSAVDEVVETVTGLHSEAMDVLALGAALRAAAGRPLKRAFTEGQGETRRAEETTVGDALNSPARLERLYRERVQEEALRLHRRYPRRAA